MVHSSHVTRFSDASTFDEICVNCGATDRRGDESLNYPCPKSVENGGMTEEEYYKKHENLYKNR